MKKIISLILLLSISLNGCIHHIPYYQNESREDFHRRVNNLCNGKLIVIELTDGKKYYGKEIKVSTDSTSFIEITSNTTQILRTKEILSISFDESGRGMFEGFLYGALIGGVIGIIPQLPGAGGTPKGDIYAIIYISIIGAGLGSIYGLLTGSNTIIKFEGD